MLRPRPRMRVELPREVLRRPDLPLPADLVLRSLLLGKELPRRFDPLADRRLCRSFSSAFDLGL